MSHNGFFLVDYLILKHLWQRATPEVDVMEFIAVTLSQTNVLIHT